jgi:hypothetical protein
MKSTTIVMAAISVIALAGVGLSQEGSPPSKPKRAAMADISGYTVSAKAGAVNIVEGDVTYRHADGDWDLLIAGDDLKSGDRVRTRATGRAEILLNPGSYLRMSENTEVVFLDTSLGSLKVELLEGSVIIEAAMLDTDKTAIATVVTPAGKLLIALGGLYRFNVEEAKTMALVRKGRLIVPHPGETLPKGGQWIGVSGGAVVEKIPGLPVKAGRMLVIENGARDLVAFDKKAGDEFDSWSRNRAQLLIVANRRLSNRAFNNSSIARAMMWSNSGNWVYNAFSGSWTFLPGLWGFTSPYGGGYSTCTSRHYGYPFNGGWTGGTGEGTGGGGGIGGGSGGGAGGGNGAGSGAGGKRHGETGLRPLGPSSPRGKSGTQQ